MDNNSSGTAKSIELRVHNIMRALSLSLSRSLHNWRQWYLTPATHLASICTVSGSVRTLAYRLCMWQLWMKKVQIDLWRLYCKLRGGRRGKVRIKATRAMRMSRRRQRMRKFEANCPIVIAFLFFFVVVIIIPSILSAARPTIGRAINLVYGLAHRSCLTCLTWPACWVLTRPSVLLEALSLDWAGERSSRPKTNLQSSVVSSIHHHRRLIISPWRLRRKVLCVF